MIKNKIRVEIQRSCEREEEEKMINFRLRQGKGGTRVQAINDFLDFLVSGHFAQDRAQYEYDKQVKGGLVSKEFVTIILKYMRSQVQNLLGANNSKMSTSAS